MNQQIPDSIKKMADDPRIYEAVEKIGGKFDLHIDQMGELDAEIRRIILGLSPSANFVKNVCELLEIDQKKSVQIAEDVNSEILRVFKSNLQIQTQQDSQDLSALEQPTSTDHVESTMSSIETAGGFTIDRPNSILESSSGITATDRAKILTNVEIPPGSKPQQQSSPVFMQPKNVMPKPIPAPVPPKPIPEPAKPIPQPPVIPTSIAPKPAQAQPIPPQQPTAIPTTPKAPTSVHATAKQQAQTPPPSPRANDPYKEPFK